MTRDNTSLSIKDLANEPVQFFLINLTERLRHSEEDSNQYSQAPDAMEFLRKKGLTDITVLQDPTGRTARANGVSNVLPSLLIIDKYGIVKKNETGLCSSCLKDELTPLIEELIKK
tara:strand:- start:81 stop:428 length:348 start_codon:yes stop_codon:yes gene_type:complete